MATKTSSAAIGAFVLGGLALAVALLLAAGAGRWFETSVERVVLFDESLQGLQAGAPVSYNGIDIGRVGRVVGSLDPGGERIRTAAVLELRGDTLVAETDAGIGEIVDRLVARGLRARLSTQSFVTGSLYVSLVFRPDARTYPAPDTFLGAPTLPAVPSGMARFGRLADMLGEQLPETLAQLNRLVDRVSAVVDEANREHLATALEGVARLGESLGAAGPGVERLVDEAGGTIERLDGLLARLGGLAGTLDAAIGEDGSAVRATLDNLRQASARLARTTERLQSLAAETGPPVSAFAAEGLPQITALAQEASAVVRQLGRVLDRLESEGAGSLLRGETLPEYEPRN